MVRKKVRTMVASTVAATALVAGGATAATAVISYVGGGTWQHGESSNVWSYYLHETRCHGSSVQGEYFDSDQVSAGYWSLASAPSRWYAVDSTYWRYC